MTRAEWLSRVRRLAAADRGMGLRLRLVLFILPPMMLLVGGYAFLRVREDEAALHAQYQRRAAVTSKAIQLAVEQGWRDGVLADVERLISSLVARQTDIVRIRLIDPAFRPLLNANLLSGYTGLPDEQLGLVLESGQATQVSHRWSTFRLHTEVLPLRPRGASVEGVLEIVFLAAGLEQDLRSVAYKVGIPLASLFLALVLLMWIVLRHLVLRPLGPLMVAIQRLGEGQLGPPVPVARPDEMGQVTQAFNQMAERLDAARQELLSETERSLELQRHLGRVEVLAAAGKLCSSIAHEVGTPLNIIAARTELLLRAAPRNDPRREDLEAILAQIDRTSKIIHTLLDPIRAHAAEPEPTALGAALEGLLPLLRHAARRRGVGLKASVPPDLPKILVDPGRLQQVLINLLMNALEATPAGGRVELTARRLNHAEPAIEISVKDTGRGISPDLLPRIFEPFFTTKSAKQGTGLGLAVCHDIVKQHGGEIRVESEPGVGTTFNVVLPEAERGVR
ncbi:MAG: ATP-binding protein [Candidatus Rokuibacteriota bacterium]